MKWILFILAIQILSGCATKRVMKDCDKTGIENYYFCSEQYKIWR